MAPARSVVQPLAVLLLALTGVVALSNPPAKPLRGPHQEPMLPRAELLNIVGAAHRQLLSDYFWIQGVQATGRARDRYGYRDIYFYASLATRLDPWFRAVYHFAGAAVTYNLGRETWVNTEESTELLSRGTRLFRDDVPMRVLLAYNLSYYHQRYDAAAELLNQTATLPGAPPFLPALATRLYAQAGNTEKGLQLARQVFETTSDPEMRSAFELRIKELELEQTLQAVEVAVGRFRAREGRLPASVFELVGRGDLPAVPTDPFGGSIELSPRGEVRASSQWRRLRVFTEEVD